MKNIFLVFLLLSTFLLAVLTPDWKSQLVAQAGGCSPMSGFDHGVYYGTGLCLDGNYKGSTISEKVSP